MKINKWVLWITIWVAVLIISLILLLTPFKKKKEISATDFISDSADFVGILTRDDSLIKNLFFLPDKVRDEIIQDVAFLQTCCDSLLVAGYEENNSFSLLWVCINPHQKIKQHLNQGWYFEEKNGFAVISRDKKRIEHALNTLHSSRTFTATCEIFEKTKGCQWFTRKIPAFAAGTWQVLNHNSWKKLLFRNDTFLFNIQIESIIDHPQDFKLIKNPDSIYYKIPSYVDKLSILAKPNSELQQWQASLPVQITAPWGWFDIKQTRVYFAWIEHPLKQETTFDDGTGVFSFRIYLKSNQTWFWIKDNEVAYWSKDSFHLENAIQQLMAGNNLLNRQKFLTIKPYIRTPFAEIHLTLNDFPNWKTYTIHFKKQLWDSSHVKKFINEDYLLPSYQFYRIHQNNNTSYLLIHGDDGFLYVFTPGEKSLIKTPAFLPKFVNAQVFKSSDGEKLYVFIGEKELQYIQTDQKKLVPGRLSLPDGVLETFIAIFLDNPPGWRLVYLSREGTIKNIQLSGLPTQGWNPKLPRLSAKTEIYNNDEHYFIKDQKKIYILNRTGKLLYQGAIHSNIYLSGNSICWIGEKRTLYRYTEKKIIKHGLPSDVEGKTNILFVSGDGVAIQIQEKILISDDYVYWKKIAFPFNDKVFKKIYLHKIQDEWKGVVLLESGHLYALNLNMETLNFETTKIRGLYVDIGYDNYQFWGILSGENLLRFF